MSAEQEAWEEFAETGMGVLKIAYTGEGVPIEPSKPYPGDAGWDLYVSRSEIIYPGQTADIHTDIRMGFPNGYWGRIVGRSSAIRKRRLLITEGIIDQGYTGELFIAATNLSTEKIKVEIGERLAQIIFQPVVSPVAIEIVRELPRTDRGENGFGSTGF